MDSPTNEMAQNKITLDIDVKTVDSSPAAKRVCIIGGGIFGHEAALSLKKAGFDVFVFDSGKHGPEGTSVKYSCHLHPTGLHYCRLPPEKYVPIFSKNCERYREEKANYLRPNPNSIHGILDTDAKGQPSRTTSDEFLTLSKLDPTSRPIKLSDFNLKGLKAPIAIAEERIITGDELKEQFRLEYIKYGIEFCYGTPVTDITREYDGYLVTVGGISAKFDYVVNATGFQKIIPESFKDNPFDLEVIYQTVVALIYEDTEASEKEIFSLLTLDGASACLMPTANFKEYLLTHGAYTTIGSFSTQKEAEERESTITSDFILEEVKPKAEADLSRYVNDFDKRFKYVGYNSGLIAKLNTENEFRLGFSFVGPDGIIYLFPGKFASSLPTGDEVVQLIKGEFLLDKNGYKYLKNGMLDIASKEVAQKPNYKNGLHYACMVNYNTSVHTDSSIGSTKQTASVVEFAKQNFQTQNPHRLHNKRHQDDEKFYNLRQRPLKNQKR